MNVIDKCHVMIDVETYGKSSKAVIRSIGMVVFDLKGETEALVHNGIDVESCLMAGLEVDQDTIDFWRNQPKEIREKLIEMNRCPLVDALLSVKYSVESIPEVYVWSHGSNFDIVILENAYKAVGMKPWWNYKNVRDTRTLFDVAGYTYKAKGGHDALEDAMNQAKAVQEAYQQLNQRRDTANKVQFLLDTYVKTTDGKFCFPDGDIWDTKKEKHKGACGVPECHEH